MEINEILQFSPILTVNVELVFKKYVQKLLFLYFPCKKYFLFCNSIFPDFYLIGSKFPDFLVKFENFLIIFAIFPDFLRPKKHNPD